ncbi:hypothetical protein [Catenovulum agarivorans]|uniref:hypothetical protein n=1 Tax=Catenovulum agarivorans TaxID=1172192 RepID=UPI000370ADFE|nr:hypothetical protein [Catenovulum agarivorans]
MNEKSKVSMDAKVATVPTRLLETDLNHTHTPEDLLSINKLIIEQLSADNVDDTELLSLIEQRDDCVQSTLEQLGAAPEQQKEFALAETEVNNKLIRVCNQLVKQAQNDLTKLVKGRKAIRQYR